MTAEQASRRAEEEEARERERRRMEREWERWRASLTGPELLDQLQREAQEQLRCPETISEDPPAVCGKKIRGEGAGLWRFFCARHDVPSGSDKHQAAHVRGDRT